MKISILVISSVLLFCFSTFAKSLSHTYVFHRQICKNEELTDCKDTASLSVHSSAVELADGALQVSTSSLFEMKAN